jgi:hypothetical protein
MSDDRFYWMAPTLLAGAIYGGCYLEKLLNLSGWVVRSDQSWQLVASGWSLLAYCWPILLIGTAAGCLLSEIFPIRLWELTRGRLLQHRLNEATKEKMDARRLARAELEEREKILTVKERVVRQREAAVDKDEAAWEAHDLDMQQQLDNERDRANRAESQLRDANAVARRHREELAKLEARKSNAQGAAARHKRRNQKTDDDVDYSGNPNPRR